MMNYECVKNGYEQTGWKRNPSCYYDVVPSWSYKTKLFMEFDKGIDMMKEDSSLTDQPYLEANPHFYLEHGQDWFKQLNDEGMPDIEIRTDFDVPYGVVMLVQPNGIKRAFELKDGKL